jgi:hypothetical protein
VVGGSACPDIVAAVHYAAAPVIPKESLRETGTQIAMIIMIDGDRGLRLAEVPALTSSLPFITPLRQLFRRNLCAKPERSRFRFLKICQMHTCPGTVLLST